jgi:hypothetical protein
VPTDGKGALLRLVIAYLNRTTGDGAVILTNSDVGYRAVMPLLERLQADAAFLGFLRSQAN